jgi:hypothetical protein
VAGFTTYAQQKLLDLVTGKATYAIPTAGSVWLALFTAAPTDAGGGTETTYTNYVRLQTVAANWNAASGTTTSNAATLTLATCGTTGATITHAALFDAVTGGNMLRWGALGSSLAISTGIAPSFAGGTPGQIVLTCD